MADVQKEAFGKTEDGRQIVLFTMRNKNGMSASFTNLGCAIVSILVVDRAGKIDDVVLGYQSGEEYVIQSSFLGVVAGRHANRIGKGTFELNGKRYKLFINNMSNHLHGGKEGFDKKLWDYAVEEGKLVFSYFSADGEEGYPGNLKTKVVYSLTDDNAVQIEYHAVSDADTVVNLTNHSYFNLAGHAAGNAINQSLIINADQYTECDSEVLPTGVIADVEGTPMDFRAFHKISERIDADFEQIKFGGGYDQNWVLCKKEGALSFAAQLMDENSGRIMQVYTTKPGIQLYSGNFLSAIGKGGALYGRGDGVCLETQFFPNAMEHRHFPSPVLSAFEHYSHKTIFRFATN